MSPSDKIIAGTNSKGRENQSKVPLKSVKMDSTPQLSLGSTSNGTLSGAISSIPLITASLSTLKCSISDQMKTFDPGDKGAIERLISFHCEKSGSNIQNIPKKNGNCGLVKNVKNYKAGSKINKLADMLAKRSQNVVEVTQNHSSKNVTDITLETKTAVEVAMNDVSDVANLSKNLEEFQRSASNNELDIFRRNRRKSVPNQSCNFSQLKMPSVSKSCLDLSNLFFTQEMKENNEEKQEREIKEVAKGAKPKLNALGASILKLQTDESTKRKAIRKNLKNIELTLILPEKKRRFSTRTENFCNKLSEENASREGNDMNLIIANSNKTSSLASPIHNVSSTNLKKVIKGRHRKSKRLVEMSTQTGDIEFISLSSPKKEDDRLKEFEAKDIFPRAECIHCSQKLTLEKDCQDQISKNAKQIIKCQFCSKKISTVNELKLHYIKKHPNKYISCVKCIAEGKEDKSMKEIESNTSSERKKLDITETIETFEEKKNDDNRDDIQIEKSGNSKLRKAELKIDVSCEAGKKSSISPRNPQKCSPKEVKTEEQLIEMEMLFYSHLSGNIQENLANHLDGKMRQNGCPISTDNTTEFLIGSSLPVGSLSVKAKSLGSSPVMANVGIQEEGLSRAPSPYKTRSKTPNPLPPATAKKFKKLPNWQQKFWEKYNFPTNYRYEHRFWDKNYLDTEKSALFLKDLSCLDIKTQLVMRENIKKLESLKLAEDDAKKSSNIYTFPKYLSLVPKINNDSVGYQKECESRETSPSGIDKNKKQSRKELPLTAAVTRKDIFWEGKRQGDKVLADGKVVTRRQNSLDWLMREDTEENSRKRKGSLDLSTEKRMTLRRQISADNLQKYGDFNVVEKASRMLEIGLTGINAKEGSLSPAAEISGEWVKSRSYLCGTCCSKFTNLWELEDHKWVSHPNVWCTHYEFEDEKIEKLFQVNEEGDDKRSEMASNVRLADLYKRYLLPHGTLKTAKLVPSISYPEQCTKCKKSCLNSSEMHKHILDCGGDTNWFLTMFSSPMTVKKKWRPFGSRRRKQIGRRDIKRNIPNTPNLRSYHYQHRIRTKPGDVESIQKMLANLPEKRTRRAINFDEIKTRSQVTIHSNRMLRKRFKSSFANNYLKMKTLKDRRSINSAKKEVSSKSTTDTSSESTPVGSPKRRNRLREVVHALKDESGADVSNESSSDGVSITRMTKKNNDMVCSSLKVKAEHQKSGRQKKIQVQVKSDKLQQKNLNSESSSSSEKLKKKFSSVSEETCDQVVETLEIQRNRNSKVKEENEISRCGKKPNKSTSEPNREVARKESRAIEIFQTPVNPINHEREKKHKKKVKLNPNVKGKNKEGKKAGKSSGGNSHDLLKLKYSCTKEKTDLVKRMKKSLMNSKRILEIKESATSGNQNGSRRSLRLKSLQGVEENVRLSEERISERNVNVEGHDCGRKQLKIKRSLSEVRKPGNKNLCVRELKVKKSDTEETTKPRTASGDEKYAKIINDKNSGHEIKEPEICDKLRRSSRCLPIRSFSREEKNDENWRKSLLVSSTLRKHSKNVFDNTESNDSVLAKKFRKSESSLDISLSDYESCTAVQESTLTTSQKSPLRRGNHSNSSKKEIKNNDLEEMPVLAKMEPLQGKFHRKKEEKDIPILSPATELGSDNAIGLQITKKRKTPISSVTAKKETYVKVIKKTDSFRLKESSRNCNSLKSLVTGRTKKNLNLRLEKEITQTEPRPRKTCKKCNKYFLGICPCEIDKGGEKDDSGGSDSEPLIMLINHSQKKQISSSDASKKKEEKEEEVVFRKVTDGVPNESFKEKVDEELLEKVDSKTMLPPLPGLIQKKEEGLLGFTEKTSENFSEKIPKNEGMMEKKEERRKISKKKLQNEQTFSIELNADLLHKPSQPIQPNDENCKQFSASQYNSKSEGEAEIVNEVLPERRSRRISKETKSTSEFVIDDPLILVDELWSDLDSDSELMRRKTKRARKKITKRKMGEEKKGSDVNLEELLRNFGEKKGSESVKNTEGERVENLSANDIDYNTNTNIEPLTFESTNVIPTVSHWPKISRGVEHLRQILENRNLVKSCRRLSLRLFMFNKQKRNLGSSGQRLAEAKMISRGFEEKSTHAAYLPDLPFLVAEIKENPVQVIQCGIQKPKPFIKKKLKDAGESKHRSHNTHFKISLPLECINNLALFNNNHLMEIDVEKEVLKATESQEKSIIKVHKENQFNENMEVLEGSIEISEILKNKIKRSDVIDKIFYCEICQTYYYSSSQLKIHKLSNRHKMKETKMQPVQSGEEDLVNEISKEDKIKPVTDDSGIKKAEPICDFQKEASFRNVEESEKIMNDDILEMPTLEGPFLENPVNREETVRTCAPPPPPLTQPLKFCKDSLKDIQRAIGCTDEEMLILTLLGENAIEVENDVLDLDTGKSIQSGKRETVLVDHEKNEKEKSNGLFKVDLKQRMTSALTSLVNRAVFNLLQKYESMAKTSVNPEAISLLGKLSSLSRRQNILHLNDLLKHQKDGEPAIGYFRKHLEKKEPTLSYKYQCTFCGSRFEKASTRDCHISRSHKAKTRKFSDEIQVLQNCGNEDWNDYWNYDPNDHSGNTSQFWCSDCGINFLSPQEVLEHQKLEHQAVRKELDKLKDMSPLQSSTIGSSDEIFEGKKSKRRSKVFSSEELNQQRILANNELRKLDRKFTNKNKSGKIKWGMDALRFTVEKEKKLLYNEPETKDKNEYLQEKVEGNKEMEKIILDPKSMEFFPKLNFTKSSNISEFKVIQKNSLKSRFQNIIDNKLKRKVNRHYAMHQPEDESERESKQDKQQEKCHSVTSRQSMDNESYEMETEVMLVPVMVKKKTKKQKFKAKKNLEDKAIDIYDFNESESDGEPMVLSHIKKPMTLPMKLKLVKVKEKPSKNKADSTTKDLIPDDYDSEDSLPLSVVRKWKSNEEEEEEKISEDGMEKSDGILEQVEYLIEQLENDTSTGKKKTSVKKEHDKNIYLERENINDKVEEEKEKKEIVEEAAPESLKVSLVNSLLSLSDFPIKNKTISPKSSNEPEAGTTNKEPLKEISTEQESTQSASDEEDSLPLLLISKKPDDQNGAIEETKGKLNAMKECDENITDVSTTASEDVPLFEEKGENLVEEDRVCDSPLKLEPAIKNSLSPVITEESTFCESLDGNVIYCRNESMSNFESDCSNDGLINSNYEPLQPETELNKNYLKEITEKEDVVIVCSKSDRQISKPGKGNRKRIKPTQRRKKNSFKSLKKSKKKIFPLLKATVKENNFKRSNESNTCNDAKLNKEVIVRKIWNRKKLMEESSNEGEDLFENKIVRGDKTIDKENEIDHGLGNDEFNTEIEKEVIVNKIWSRKKLDYDFEVLNKSEDLLKINQTEVSDEVIIKCGPKTPLASLKRRQRNKGSTNESSKETIMRKIWSGKCIFQTKAALKTYDSDVVANQKETSDVLAQSQVKRKKRGRPARFATKKIRIEEADKDDEDDLDSLLEEIDREQLEKAIRLEFLQLRRSEKGSAEMAKDGPNPTLGLFTETTVRHKRDGLDKKRKRLRRNLARNPRQSLLKRKKFMKKTIRRTLPPDNKNFAEKHHLSQDIGREESRENQLEDLTTEKRTKSRKHKKHRHKHHHHKHKHKKSKHRKYLVSKHKSKYKSDREESADDSDDEATTDITKSEAEKAEPEVLGMAIISEGPDTVMTRLMDTICEAIPGQMDSSNALQLPSPFTFEDSTKDYDEGDEQPSENNKISGSIYDFAEDASDLSVDAYKCRN